MKKLGLCLAPFLFVFLSGCGVDKEKLVGVWEV